MPAPFARSADTFAVDPAWAEMLRHLGVAPESLLQRARLPADTFTRGVGLETEAWFRLWQSLDDERPEPTFALRLVESVAVETFMPPFFAALCSPNLRVACERIATYKRLVGPMQLVVTRPDHDLRLELRWLGSSRPAPASLVIAELAFLLRVARLGTQQPIRPTAIVTPASVRSRLEATAFFQCAAHVGDAPSLVFRKADAELAFATENDEAWRHVEPELRGRLAHLPPEASTSARVRAVLLESLPSGESSVGHVAARLALGTRTLQRRLAAEATSYQTVLDKTREELARSYLVGTQLSCVEIGFLLGFDDPNSFFRAFQEWTGQTPDAVRRSERGPRRRQRFA